MAKKRLLVWLMLHIYTPNINAGDDVSFRGDKVVQIEKMIMENGSMFSDY